MRSAWRYRELGMRVELGKPESETGG